MTGWKRTMRLSMTSGICLFIVSLASVTPLHAQRAKLLSVGRMGGQLLFRYQFEKKVSTKTVYIPTFREVVSLNNRFAVVSPRILKISWNGDFNFIQERYIWPGYNQKMNGNFFSNLVSLSLFSKSPYSLSVMWNKSANIQSVNQGGRLQYKIQYLRAIMNLPKFILPSNLIVSSKNLNERWDRLIEEDIRKQEEKNVSFNGKRGWKSATLTVTYNFLDIQNRLYPNFSYSTNNAYVNFIKNFGKNKTVRQRTSLQYSNRRGIGQYQIVRAGERLSVRLPFSFGLRFFYRFSLLKTPQNKTRLNTVYSYLSHQLFKSLSTNVGGGITDQLMTRGKSRIFMLSGGVNYTKRIPLAGNLQINYSGSRTLNNNRLQTQIQNIVQEKHIFWNGMPVRLNQRNIIVSSILVYNVRKNIIYEEGADKDYTVLQIGDYVEIYRNPFGRITEGETVSFDYQFHSLPSMDYETNISFWSIVFTFKHLSFYYRASRQAQTPSSPGIFELLFLENRRLQRGGIQLKWSRNLSRLILAVEGKDYFSSRTVPYRSVDLKTNYFFRPARELTISTGITVSILRYVGIKRRLQIYTYRTQMIWNLHPGRSFRGYVSVRNWNDSVVGIENSYEFAGIFRMSWKIFTMRISYKQWHWIFYQREIQDRRFWIEIARKL